MSRLGLRLLESQLQQIQGQIFHDDNEAAVIALCGRSMVPDPWGGGADERFIVKEIIPVPESAYVERTPTRFTWSTTPFLQALKRAESTGLAVAVIHSHPANCPDFSEHDDVAERELFEIAFNRLESRRPHLSVVMDRSGGIKARAYRDDLVPVGVDSIMVIGERYSCFPRVASVAAAELDRQVRAFGAQATADMGQLRIGIVGCGGTGSAIASLLARVGARHLALFDRDRVEGSNVNRLHFSTRTDASLRRLKVDVVAEGAAEIGLPMDIVRVPHFADETRAIEVLRACDVVFGCTDDNLGRLVLDRLARFYFIPVIDLGLLIEPAQAGGYDVFDGRVTIVQPGYTCQVCRGLVTQRGLYLDGLRRDPEILHERRRAGYAPNDPDPSPVVVTFTTEVACMAINELFHRLNGFRGPEERCSERVRRFDYLKDADSLPGGVSRPGCKACDLRSYDGRGDISRLLDMTL